MIWALINVVIALRQGVTVKLRPPIFRKEIENEKKCANLKGNFGLLREMLV